MGNSDLQSLREAATLPPIPELPRFELRRDGLYFIDGKIDPDSGKVHERPPLWLCDPLELVGTGVDDNGHAYRIARWRSRADQSEQREAIACASIGEREGWGRLRAKGLAVSSKRTALEQLALYLQLEGRQDLHHVTERGGWRNGAYVLPSGEVLGHAEPPLFYTGDRSHASAYQAHGSLSGWREGVARLAQGNSRVMLAIGTALAAPLLELAGLESGGIHLFGASGCGKTTSAKAGASVWGEPAGQMLNWDATALALANAAAARNDGLMLLDEVGQGDPRAIGMAAYRLFNGVGKMQGAKDGGNREQARWRVLVLSTGESDLAGFMASGGQRTHAGQEVRLASLPADAGRGLGTFDTLNGCTSAGALAKKLEQAAREHHGTVGQAFVEWVAERREEVATRLRHAIRDMRDLLPPEASGQVRRVASRFALISEALELATKAGLTGWAVDEGKTAVFGCMAEWIDRYGLGNREDVQILEQMEGWFALHARGRFINWDSASKDSEPAMRDCAGYFRRLDGELQWLVFPSVFVNEIAAGFDRSVAADVATKAGMLKRGGDGKATSMHRTPDHNAGRRFYCFTAITRQSSEATS
ncbi:DUF927 domain-containing protein [Laribacter hongkongensis]|uniref:DUF927 domain-containing protein n=1 Tax=Laribacter hongkongensis TaxID=168471 RepID=UPI001EFE4620|nr:DUF927 domain-containing protein [Laribacter hongkongensis]MCG8994147.1 DUF927 domain-containing protein [Laribacter hongkongensis]MCG9011788.1 DUF927 domain-containing protein [Laribacter hongkongensis]MCG9046739.1 DUF927 domain-containing protein [Laribacter hongkongensis]MCG9072712.1 DUF927 domain-containing protein [Laribacter hongkongensis]